MPPPAPVGRRPVIFLTNGFDTRIRNGRFEPERRVAGVWSKRDLVICDEAHCSIYISSPEMNTSKLPFVLIIIQHKPT